MHIRAPSGGEAPPSSRASACGKFQKGGAVRCGASRMLAEFRSLYFDPYSAKYPTDEYVPNERAARVRD